MQSLLVSAIVVLFCCITSSAQTSVGAMVAGVHTSARISPPPDVLFESGDNRSYMIGGVVNSRIDSTWSFRLEPAYIIKGATMWHPFFLPDAEHVSTRWSYAELAILLAGEYDLGGVGVGGLAGILPSLLLSGETTIDVWNNATGEYESGGVVDLKDRMSFYDLAISFGLSIRYPVTDNVDILGEVRRSVGVVDILHHGGVGYLSKDDRMQVGVLIGL